MRTRGAVTDHRCAPTKEWPEMEDQYQYTEDIFLTDQGYLVVLACLRVSCIVTLHCGSHMGPLHGSPAPCTENSVRYQYYT